MNLPLKRIAAVALTVCLLGAAAGTVYAGGRGPASQPQPRPQPQPKPQPAQQNTSKSSAVIGSLSSGSTIGSLGNGSSIGSLSSGSAIGTLAPTNPQPQPKPNPKPRLKDPEPERGGGRRSQNDAHAEARLPNNPPPQSRPAEQPKPAEGPQVVQQTTKNPAPEQPKPAQAQAPIIIMPKSVSNGNSSRGNTYRDTTGYTGGNGNGPLIYNP